MSVAKLTQMRDVIEGMTKYNQVEILRILDKYKDTITLNENKYGVHVNLTELNDTILDELNEYVSYVLNQENALKTAEKEKDHIKNEFFS